MHEPREPLVAFENAMYRKDAREAHSSSLPLALLRFFLLSFFCRSIPVLARVRVTCGLRDSPRCIGETPGDRSKYPVATNGARG